MLISQARCNAPVKCLDTRSICREVNCKWMLREHSFREKSVMQLLSYLHYNKTYIGSLSKEAVYYVIITQFRLDS